MPENCTAKINSLHTNIQTGNGADLRFYGNLFFRNMRENFLASFYVYPVWLSAFHDDLIAGALFYLKFAVHVSFDNNDYWDNGTGVLSEYRNYVLENEYHYNKRSYAGGVKTIEFIFSPYPFEDENFTVADGIGGGAPGFVTAEMDKRVKFMTPPIDFVGYQPGGPGFEMRSFSDRIAHFKKINETLHYYDDENVTQISIIPPLYPWVYNDSVSTPSFVFSAYKVNQILKDSSLAHDT